MRPLSLLVSFLLAFLLFSLQPMATKLVLPTLGGSPAVWNTAMLVFQVLLLLGYFYAHVLTSYFKPRAQLVLHAVVIACSYALLPIAIALEATDAVVHSPIVAMSRTLLLQVGLPFFVLAATAPLLQSWVTRSHSSLAQTPYVLYSASNFGSLLALIGYVVAVEPLLDLPQQQSVWSYLYAAGTLALLLAGVQLLRHAAPVRMTTSMAIEPLRIGEIIAWVGLAFLPSALSLGVTNYIATDIASAPLLWVVPLAIYLLSFVDAFRTKPLLVGVAQRFAPLLGLAAVILYAMQANKALYGFGFHMVAFAALALALHGHLAQRKPQPARLTLYYVCLSIGGALGGVLNALIAPMLLTEPLEYPAALLVASVAAFLLLNEAQQRIFAQWRELMRIVMRVLVATVILYVVLTLLRSGAGALTQRVDIALLMNAASCAGVISLILHRGYVRAVYACVGVILVLFFVMTSGVTGFTTLYKGRNFYGVEKVFERANPHARYMMHNTTLHGVQPLAEEKLRPVSYYAALKDAFDRLPALRQRVAAVGLGVGSVQCYAQRSQQFDYFEINPMVVELASNPAYFNYLSDCPGSHRMFLGDGRITLAQREDASYGAIILDAFSSDAIPAHLLTREALAMYMQKLAPHGVLLMHTTNRHIDLWPLIGGQAKALNLVAYGKNFKAPASDPLVMETYWVVVARAPSDVDSLVGATPGWQALVPDEGARVWTDHYTNILPYLKMLR